MNRAWNMVLGEAFFAVHVENDSASLASDFLKFVLGDERVVVVAGALSGVGRRGESQIQAENRG